MSEEDNLDNFFAKKDKVKKKSNKSRITPEEIGHMLEKKLAKGAKKAAGHKKEKEQLEVESKILDVKVEEDDGEWKEDEEEVVDYSNLKIQQLNLNKEEVEPETVEQPSEIQEEEQIQKKDLTMPWKTVTSSTSGPIPSSTSCSTPSSTSGPTPSSTDEVEKDLKINPDEKEEIEKIEENAKIENNEETKQEDNNKKEETSSKPTKYIPPALRNTSTSSTGITTATPGERYVPPHKKNHDLSNSSSSSPSPLQPIRLGKKKKILDVNNKDDFPTLGKV